MESRLMDSSVVLGNTGAKPEIDFRGVKYKIGHKTQRVIAGFELWAKQSSIRKILDKKKEFTDQGIYEVVKDQVETELRQIYKDIDNPDPKSNYTFNGSKCQYLLTQPEGILELIKLLMGSEADKLSKEEFEELVVEKQEEIMAYLEACNMQIAEIQKELGWDTTADPTGEKQDPKVLARYQQRMRALGMA